MGWKISCPKIACFVWALVQVFGLARPGLAAQSGDWNTLETQYTRIQYLSREDLRRFNASIDYGPGHWGAKRVLQAKPSPSLEEGLSNKVDALFERVQEILDMHPKMGKVRILLLHDKKHLAAEYHRLFKAPCHIRSWYLHIGSTIYVNSKDVRVGVLAHEMGHAVSEHFLVFRPPRVSAEVWSMYVEAHLFDD
ncbi:hypothetical protein SAMN02745216_03864 [Desulfatibacillum alkenivorans DSM 16219]|jgi:hypothetical protein|uniref:Peptidase M48 domain-containing protein n=1 Tax=Desulfatibacillum alkenivorans DSM 16219 TaxID=1121393 RepID=A0A1M6UCN5_9BACT|nr:hypothetical protein [Desulfatibacillum alkenivorans]SHK66937.1 hypothetical protein SAMN02745216_03864 [Desulfatibacillum alkenivorans DSM 16219]